MVTNAPTGPVSRMPAGTRVYAVGDVHGHADTLRDMHEQVARDLRRRPVETSVLVHLGDYIDRGPESAEVVRILAEGSPVPGMPTVNLMGNHEWMMLAALGQQTPETVRHWLYNGGDASLHSWGIARHAPPEHWAERIPAAHLVFLRDLALTHRVGNCLFVHAGVRPGIELAQQRRADLLWIREGFLDWDGPMLPEAPELFIVHGHTPETGPAIFPNRLGIDTGAGKGGTLTCAVLEAGPLRFLES